MGCYDIYCFICGNPCFYNMDGLENTGNKREGFNVAQKLHCSDKR